MATPIMPALGKQGGGSCKFEASKKMKKGRGKEKGQKKGKGGNLEQLIWDTPKAM